MLNMRTLTTFAGLALTLVLHGNALAEMAVAIPQAQAPLQILTYETGYDDKEDKLFFVEHTVKYQNVSDKEVVSARFGFVELNAFNDLLGTVMGYTLEGSDPKEKDKEVFVHEYPAAVIFEEFGTGLVWVDAVRFKDGSLWNADRALVLEELKKTKADLAATDLLEKKSIREK